MPERIAIEAQGQIFGIANRTGRPPRVNNTRGRVTSFTPAARLRLMRKLARIKAPKAVFMTLTFPARYPDPEPAKKCLWALLERFRRAYPRASAVWRMEPQKRGAPHFHLLWYNLPFIKFERLQAAWAEICADYLEEDETIFVHLKMCWHQKQVNNYVSKYVAKEGEHRYTSYDGSCFLDNGAYLHTGRCWGLHNAKCIPWAIQAYIVLENVPTVQFERVKALMRSVWAGIPADPEKGGCLFTDLAYELHHEACQIMSIK